MYSTPETILGTICSVKVIKEQDVNIDEIVRTLKEGGLIIYPTETVYGLGVDATNEKAVEKLWNFKGERGDKPVLVAVSSIDMAAKYVRLNEAGESIIRKYWPGPVSIVAVSRNKVSTKVQGNTHTLGLRMPKQDTVLKIVNEFKKPVTSTSANVSGQDTAKSLEKFLEIVAEEKQALIDLFIDAGELPVHLPSTIVDTTGDEIKVLRQGEVVVK